MKQVEVVYLSWCMASGCEATLMGMQVLLQVLVLPQPPQCDLQHLCMVVATSVATCSDRSRLRYSRVVRASTRPQSPFYSP